MTLSEKYDAEITPINHLNVEKNIDYKKIKKPNLFMRLYRGFLRAIYWLFAPLVNLVGFGFRVKGRKNLRGIKKAISVSNHVSYADCMWNVQVWRNKSLYFTVAPHNNKKGAFGRFLRASGAVPIPSSLSQTRDFADCVDYFLSKNNIVHFYGEHGLWPRYKQSRPLKKGAFHYAVTNNVPIVMIVYLFGKKRVTAQILEPIYPNATLNKKEAVDDLQHRTQKAYDDAVIKFYHYDRETYAMNKVNEPVKKRKNK